MCVKNNVLVEEEKDPLLFRSGTCSASNRFQCGCAVEQETGHILNANHLRLTLTKEICTPLAKTPQNNCTVNL